MKYALEAEDLLAAALESFERIVDGTEATGESADEKGPDLDDLVDQGDDAFIEVVGLEDRLAARAEHQARAVAELELEFDIDVEGVPILEGSAAAAGREELVSQHEDLQEEHRDLKSNLAGLEEDNATTKAKLKSLRRSQKDKTDAVRILELKIRRKDEALGLIKMERDDLAGTLKMWEKMVGEMRTAARSSEKDQERIVRRHKKELKEIQLLANEELFKKIIPALDNLELALSHSAAEGDETVEQVIQGIRMTAAHLFKSVQQAGLDRIESDQGTPFDPSIHEAVERVESLKQPADTIAVCLSPGYKLEGRLIRPARVSVFYGGPSAESENENSVDNAEDDSE